MGETLKDSIQERYNKTCFELKSAYSKLSDFTIETFILNPEIQKLTNTIKKLEEKKKNLEELIGEENEENE